MLQENDVEFTQEEKKTIFYVSKLLILGVIICFFFPFMTVSCGTGELTKTIEITGVDMVVGDEEVADPVAEFSENYSENVLGEVADEEESEDASTFNILVVVAAVFVIIELFARKKVGKYAGISCVSLVLFRISAKWYYTVGEKSLAECEDYLTVEFGWAVYIAIILLLIVSCIHWFLFKDTDS